ncbi:MAG: hypothetical protein RH860_02850 [Cytophagales bacterium]
MRVSNKFILIGIAVILAFVAIYQYLKTSTPLEIEIKNTNGFVVQGNYFEGDWKDDQIKKNHLLADSIAKQKGLISTAIYYNDPNEDDGFIKAFIGVNAPKDELNPVFEEIRIIEKGSFLSGKISNDYFSIPQRIYLEMEDFAKDKSIEIGEFSIEQYFSDTLMYVYIPIVSK